MDMALSSLVSERQVQKLALSWTGALITLKVLLSWAASSWIAYLITWGAIACVYFRWWQAQSPPDDPCGVHAEEFMEVLPSQGEKVGLRERYLSAVQASVLNLVYAESSEGMWVYDGRNKYTSLSGFSLSARLNGHDVCKNSLTMIGKRRLDNIKECVENIVAKGVEGDLIEAGCCKGGAVIFMKAVLASLGEGFGNHGRKVWACDTFCDPQKEGTVAASVVSGILNPLLSFLGSIPSPSFQRGLFKQLYKLQSSFPQPKEGREVSEDIVASMQFLIKNAGRWQKKPSVETGLESVRSHFARFRLLDDNVRFLKGFFSDTIPKASELDKVALLRADGDTYESTIDALNLLYPKLSVGGYCIIDDYNSFAECKRAVDEYRSEHGIDDPIVAIDELAVYWVRRK